MNNQIKGIIIKHVDYKEADSILNVLTPKDGKQTIYARGIRKITSKNASSCMLYGYSNFSLLERNANSEMRLLKFSENIDNFYSIREDLIRGTIASMLVEIVDRINDDTEIVFNILYESLILLKDCKQPFCLLALFISKINEQQGIALNVDECVICHKKNNIVGISSINGGFTCNDHHEDIIRFSSEELKKIRYITKITLEKYQILEEYGNYSYQLVQLFMNILIEYSGMYLNSYKVLNAIVKNLNIEG
ncbi:MAG: DNA repair protein RecO [Erysipelotrichaceae bacterium]